MTVADERRGDMLLGQWPFGSAVYTSEYRQQRQTPPPQGLKSRRATLVIQALNRGSDGIREYTLAFEHEKRAALRLLQGIELGTMTADESYRELREADPTLVHLIFTWLRKRYRDHPAAEGVQ